MQINVAIAPYWRVGDIIKLDGKSHKITKKTTTAIAVERYYWFDRLVDKYLRRTDNEIS